MGNPRNYDVIVIGGGMAGCAAAATAAENGCKTLLIESFGFLGGWATAALVNPFMSYRATDGKQLVGGFFQGVLDRLADQGGLAGNSFDSEVMKSVLQEWTLSAGVELLLHTFFDRAEYTADGTILVRTLSKSGRCEHKCQRLIDCSGDGDAAVSLGADYEMGDQDGRPQAVTLMFDVGGVDMVRVLEYVRANPDQMRFPKLTPDANIEEQLNYGVGVAGYYDLIAQARSRGEYAAPGDLIFFITRPTPGQVVFNTTHVGGVSGADAEDLTRAEIEGRRQMMSIVAFVKKYVPGFEDSHLVQSAPHVGVRESRRVVGEHKFCAQDVIEARKFEDAVCRLAYPVDIHSGKGDGYTREEEKEVVRTPPPGDWYEIPYRCLVPLKIENVLVAGRCASSTQEGHGAIRIMPSCAAMGEAAGMAAAMSLQQSTTPRSLDGRELRRRLKERGALL
jgi:hypothetical protein